MFYYILGRLRMKLNVMLLWYELTDGKQRKADRQDVRQKAAFVERSTTMFFLYIIGTQKRFKVTTIGNNLESLAKVLSKGKVYKWLLRKELFVIVVCCC